MLGFVEVHIEQASVLDSRDVPVGVVQAIVGQSRLSLRIEGQAGHAGTTPMDARKDALVAAAEIVVEVERRAQGCAGLVATVGRLEVGPNASNVIPERVDLSLDVRHRGDPQRRAAVRGLVEFARARARARGLHVEVELDGERDAAVCDAEMTAMLADAVEAAGCPVVELPSLAGHDAMVMARAVPISMLFVRSPGGLSHHPDEAVEADDVVAAARVLERYVEGLAGTLVERRVGGWALAREDVEFA